MPVTTKDERFQVTVSSDRNSITVTAPGPQGPGGGGGGGASDLPDLGDVDDATTPTSGHYLRGDGSEWANSAIQDADLPGTIARDSEVTSAVSAHESDTTNIHGITDTAVLETTTGSAAKVETHRADTTDVHGIADTSVLATDSEVATAVSDHSADTTSVHGIADTANLETTTGSQGKVDAHTGDGSDAHDASAISFAPAGAIAATDVQAAIEEVASEAGATAMAGCKAIRTTNQSLTNSTVTAVLFTSEEWDTDGFHDNSTDSNRLTVPTGKGGKYMATVGAIFASNATGRRLIRIAKNGTALFARTDSDPVASSITTMTAVGEVILAAGDYIEVQVFQNSGGSLNLTDGTGSMTDSAGNGICAFVTLRRIGD